MRMMIKVQEAQEIILKNIQVLPCELIRLEDALGRVMAEDVCSDSNIPAFDNSAMDGYALAARDTGDAPKALEVIGDLKAGDVPRKTLGAGQAMRIMTGAPIPRGADAVVMVEDTERLEVRGKRLEGEGEKTRDFQIVLEYKPQRLFEIGVLISGVTFVSCIGYLCFSGIRGLISKKNQKNNMDLPLRYTE